MAHNLSETRLYPMTIYPDSDRGLDVLGGYASDRPASTYLGGHSFGRGLVSQPRFLSSWRWDVDGVAAEWLVGSMEIQGARERR